MPTRLLRPLVFCVVLSLTVANAHGQTKTWVGPNGGNWNTASNWSPAVLPGYTDDVVIYHPTGDSVNLNPGNVAINSLTLGGSGLPLASLLTGFGQGVQNLNINYDLTIGQSGDLELYAGDNVQVGGGLRSSGRLYVGPGAQMGVEDATSTIAASATFDIQGSFTQGYIDPLTSLQGRLYLHNGQTWTITGYTSTPLTIGASGTLDLGKGTSMGISNDVVNQGVLTTTGVTSGRNSYLAIFGSLTNNAYFNVDNGDRVDVFSLTNNSQVTVGTGATLNLVMGRQPGITDIPANTGFQINGTFTQSYNTLNPSPFYNLTTIEGSLSLYNGQTTDITPNGNLVNSGFLVIAAGSTVNIHGTLNNSGGSSAFGVFDAGSVVNVDMLTNSGLVYVSPGATLNLTNQPGGITDVVAGSTFDIAGTFNAGTLSGFNSLTFIEGTVMISNGQTIQDNPTNTGLTLMIASGGSLTVSNGSSFYIHSNINVTPGANIYLDPSTLVVEGAFYNSGGNITVDGNSVFSVGSVVNGGPLMLTHNAGMTVNNGFYQLASGTLGASIDATGSSVIVVNGGPVMLDGTLDVLLDPNFNPTIGSFYKFLLFQPGELSGTFASIQNDYFNGTEKWVVIYDNADGYVELEAAPAPEPSSLLLLSSGLLGLAYGIRRRVK